MRPHHKKEYGAFYTDPGVVSFLVDWAVRQPGQAVMDPSCGDGRFLREAANRGVNRIVGVDLHPAAVAAARQALAHCPPAMEWWEADFFSIEPGQFAELDAIVGNPPFVRYQRFSDSSRRLALESALRLGVRLTRLTSTWAPFLLHAVQFLKSGGRLAMVVPAEIIQTQYGLPTLRALLDRFSSVTLISFERNIFREAQTDTCLLLAEGHGGSTKAARIVPVRSAADLNRLSCEPLSLDEGTLAFSPLGDTRYVEAFLTPAERRAWERTRAKASVVRLGDLGTLANGYVSGDNRFFHRTRCEAAAAGYPSEWLLSTARNGRTFRGLRYTAADVEHHELHGNPHHLVLPDEGLFSDAAALEHFVAEGTRLDVHQRFKCRTRRPWWRVPGLNRADVLFTYMAGSRPRAVLNEIGAVYSNTLHGLRARDGTDPVLLAIAFHSSLTLLSLEIQGRSYGGGILKLEPSEMAKVQIPMPAVELGWLNGMAATVDERLRAGDYDQAVRHVDRELLHGVLGLSRYTISQLRSARRRLKERRTNRTKQGG